MYYKCHKINPNCGGSHIDSLDWIKKKKKKATMNSISKKDNKCFQDIIKVTLNREKIKKKLQRITKLKPFINKYNWERTNFSSKADD